MIYLAFAPIGFLLAVISALRASPVHATVTLLLTVLFFLLPMPMGGSGSLHATLFLMIAIMTTAVLGIFVSPAMRKKNSKRE